MPLQGSFRISTPLGDISQMYSNYEYIARDIMPERKVKKESGNYYIVNNDLRRAGNTLRANGTPATQIDFDVSTSTYTVREHALKDLVTDRDYDNVDSPPIRLDADKTEYITDKLLLELEYETWQLLFTTTSFSNSKTLTSASSWKYHTTTSAPIQDVLSSTSYIRMYAGVRPNKMVFSLPVRDALKENPNVYGRIQYVQKAILTEELLASLFEVDKVHVGSAVYETADEGITSDKGAIWSDDCLIEYVESSPGLKTKTAALNFRKTNSGNPFKVKTWRDEAVEGKWIEVSTFFRGHVISSTSGYLIKDCAL